MVRTEQHVRSDSSLPSSVATTLVVTSRNAAPYSIEPSSTPKSKTLGGLGIISALHVLRQTCRKPQSAAGTRTTGLAKPKDSFEAKGDRSMIHGPVLNILAPLLSLV